MQATINQTRKTKFTSSHRKENKCYLTVYLTVGLLDGKIATLAELRCYGTGSKNYACLWTFGESMKYRSGSGSAGGYGYDRESAAAHEAIYNAGIDLSENIAGRGLVADALKAIGNLSGATNVTVIKTHA